MDRLLSLLADHPEINVVGTALTGEEAVDLISAHHIDLVFLDVVLADMKSFELMSVIPPEVKIIIVSAYEEYALKAFDIDAVDYLLKPVFANRLETSLKRIFSDPVMAGHSLERENQRLAQLVPVRHTGSGTSIYSVDEIVYLKASRNYSYIYTVDGRREMIYRNLSQWDKRLPSEKFIRIQRSLIVNLNKIRRLVSTSPIRAEILFKGSVESCIIGRAALRRLRHCIEGGASTKG